jgi:hypothetical protein
MLCRHCPSCKDMKCAKKCMNIWTLPPILLIQLKRFAFSQYANFGYRFRGRTVNNYLLRSTVREKLSTLVDFPLTDLDMSGRISSADTSSHIYDLYAVVNHHGTIANGHCMCKKLSILSSFLVLIRFATFATSNSCLCYGMICVRQILHVLSTRTHVNGTFLTIRRSPLFLPQTAR